MTDVRAWLDWPVLVGVLLLWNTALLAVFYWLERRDARQRVPTVEQKRAAWGGYQPRQAVQGRRREGQRLSCFPELARSGRGKSGAVNSDLKRRARRGTRRALGRPEKPDAQSA